MIEERKQWGTQLRKAANWIRSQSLFFLMNVHCLFVHNLEVNAITKKKILLQ